MHYNNFVKLVKEKVSMENGQESLFLPYRNGVINLKGAFSIYWWFTSLPLIPQTVVSRTAVCQVVWLSAGGFGRKSVEKIVSDTK
jgi:hypothetical protein